MSSMPLASPLSSAADAGEMKSSVPRGGGHDRCDDLTWRWRGWRRVVNGWRTRGSIALRSQYEFDSFFCTPRIGGARLRDPG